MTIFTICIFYAPTVPIVSVAGSIFVYLRHLVDAYNLLTYYRKEIESSGRIVDKVTNTALVIVILYQMSMIAYFALHNRRSETLTCTMIFILSIFFISCTYEDVYDLAKIEENMETIGEFDEDAYIKWKNEYAHPLVVGAIRRGKTLQTEKVYPVSRESQFVDMDHLFLEQQEFDNEAIFDRRRKTGLFEMTTHGMRTKKIRESNNSSRNSNRNSNRRDLQSKGSPNRSQGRESDCSFAFEETYFPSTQGK